MEIPDKRPFVLDGAIATNLMQQGMPEGLDAADWMLQNTESVAALIDAFIQAGAMAVLAPTFGLMNSTAEQCGKELDIPQLNRTLARLAKEAARGRVPVGGSVSPSGIEIKPFGEATFNRLITDYRQQMQAFSESSLDFVLLESFTNIVDLRAAIFAAHAFELPVYACVTVDDECRTKGWDVDVLAALTVAQSLGVRGFGINCSSPDATLEAVKRIISYARVPVIAKPDAGNPNPLLFYTYDFSPQSLAEFTGELLAAGAQMIGGCCGTTPEHIKAIAEAAKRFDYSGKQPEKMLDEVIAANQSDVFFITDTLSPSEPLDCELDMSELLVEAAGEGYDALYINIKTPDDANLLAINAHMATLPILLHADEETLLEAALLQYQGRALVDSRCYIPEQNLKRIAKKYGAILY
ncbi:homocysteine S-methyltransferase family protein [Acetanaerobacterium elongatum]|uniref:5-methyltetrahydrofolate--homocysteine methyltransferase n=1 Tax=Acetanaerobacterium elongatum TaxID=258515 RepID=A0A1H0GBI5_9FIRM|nr:homocysteine S-methyltransferase family protein [Acetanaerobacterium elongatum]SDO04233.1 5-methyltetrahydrofolate--homocysteine methyltransferase [Acetanaerobacterium elongatum]